MEEAEEGELSDEEDGNNSEEVDDKDRENAEEDSEEGEGETESGEVSMGRDEGALAVATDLEDEAGGVVCESCCEEELLG